MIVATGANVNTSPALPELLANPNGPSVGRRVVIVGGGLAGIQLAEYLSARGRFVTVLEAGRTIAPEVGLKRRTEHMDRLDRLGVPPARAHRGGPDHRHRGGGVHPRTAAPAANSPPTV